MEYQPEEHTENRTVAMGGKIYSLRMAKEMTQEQLAEKVSVTRQTINAIEKGDYNPSINLCITICRVLGKTLNDLFWEE